MANKEFIKYLDKAGCELLRLRIRTEKGKVIDIVVQYEFLIEAEWTPINRYDCAHEFFHRDVLIPGGEKEKQAIGIENLNDALLYAEQDLKDRWKLYKQRYIRQKKK